MGYHYTPCPGRGGKGGGLVIAAVAVLAIGSGTASAVSSLLAAVLIAVAVLAVLAVLGAVVVLIRRNRAAEGPVFTVRPAPARGAVADAPRPQVTPGTVPAVHNYYGPQFHFSGPDAEAAAARVIRMLPAQGGDAITEEE